MAIFASAAAPAFADLSPDPAPSGPAPDPAPAKPQPKPVSHPAPVPVTQTPAPVVHTPAPAPVRVVPRVTTPVVTPSPAPAPAPAPVRHVAQKAKRQAPAHRRIVHHAGPKPGTAADPISVAVRAPVRAVRTAVTAPVKVAAGHGSTTAKLLVIAALALLLVAGMSASLLRLLVRINGPQRGW